MKLFFAVVMTTTSLAVPFKTPALMPQPRAGSSTDASLYRVQEDTVGTRWVLRAADSEARYLVREQLAGFDFPNDAVGKTSEIAGTLVLNPDGTIVSSGSEFRVQLATLTTDNDRRDGYVRRRTLEVETFPEAVLVPLRFVGLPSPLPESGSVTFELVGDLTLHGQTQPTVWDVTAEFRPEGISGMASTSFPFETFGIPVPQVARVLSVADEIRLELDFAMVPGI